MEEQNISHIQHWKRDPNFQTMAAAPCRCATSCSVLPEKMEWTWPGSLIHRRASPYHNKFLTSMRLKAQTYICCFCSFLFPCLTFFLVPSTHPVTMHEAVSTMNGPGLMSVLPAMNLKILHSSRHLWAAWIQALYTVPLFGYRSSCLCLWTQKASTALSNTQQC